MERKAIIEFGKNDITVRGVIESKTISGNLDWKGDNLIPSPIIKLDINRDYTTRLPDYTPTYKHPYTIDIPYFPKLNEDIQKSNIGFIRNLKGKVQVRNGYLLIALNLKTDIYEIKHNYWYADTIRNLDFNNALYRWDNPLNKLEADMKSLKDKKLYDGLYLFLFGDNLDFQNTNKLLYNEDNTSLSKVFPIIDTSIKFPLDFLVSDYKCSLKLKTIKIASSKNFRNNKSLSNPLNFNITFFGKIDLTKNEFVEEFILMNPTSKNNGISKIRSSIYMYTTKKDNTNIVNKIVDSTGYYDINNMEQDIIKKGGKIMYGTNYPEEMNILNHKSIKNEDEYVVVTSKINNILKQKKFKINRLMEVSQVDKSNKDSPIEIGEKVNLHEFNV